MIYCFRIMYAQIVIQIDDDVRRGPVQRREKALIRGIAVIGGNISHTPRPRIGLRAEPLPDCIRLWIPINHQQGEVIALLPYQVLNQKFEEFNATKSRNCNQHIHEPCPAIIIGAR